MKLLQVIRRRGRSLLRMVGVTLSPAYAARVANRYWQETDQTHRHQTEEDVGYRSSEVRNSWSDYRSHLILVA